MFITIYFWIYHITRIQNDIKQESNSEGNIELLKHEARLIVKSSAPFILIVQFTIQHKTFLIKPY